MLYHHTQTGTVVIVSLSVAIVFVAGLTVFLMQRAIEPFSLSTLFLNVAILAIALIVFARLTVNVAPEMVECHFGFGLLRRQFEIAAIDSVECVRNPWYYGWGIRRTPQGWMYNVSGFDAVQIQLASGKRLRIGTDEPEQLKAAIEGAIAQQTVSGRE